MGRTKGSKNKPGSKKPGRKPSSKLVERLKPEEIVKIKEKVIRLFDDREVKNLSQAANVLGVSKLKLYSWKKTDSMWADLLRQTEQLIADELEEELMVTTMPNGKPVSMPYITARIFRLKKIRPEYKDSFKLEVTDSRVLEHLAKLRELAKQEKPKELLPAENIINVSAVEIKEEGQ